MINTVISQIINCIKGEDVNYVFSAFGNQPIENMPKKIVTIVGIDSLNLKKPVHSQGHICFPFEACADISIKAPQRYGASELYDFFSSIVLERLASSTFICDEVKVLSLKSEKSFGEIALNTKIQLSGICSFERSVAS